MKVFSENDSFIKSVTYGACSGAKNGAYLGSTLVGWLIVGPLFVNTYGATSKVLTGNIEQYEIDTSEVNVSKIACIIFTGPAIIGAGVGAVKGAVTHFTR